MAGRRIARVNEQLRREITDLLMTAVRDPRVGFATVTGVSAAPDLSFARVFVSVLGEEPEKAETLEGLAAAAPFVRAELGRRLQYRRVPELRFELDRSLDHAMRIEQLLRDVGASPADEDPPTDE